MIGRFLLVTLWKVTSSTGLESCTICTLVGSRIRNLAVVERNSGEGVVVEEGEAPPLPSKEFGKTEENVVEMTSGTEVDGVTLWTTEGRVVCA